MHSNQIIVISTSLCFHLMMEEDFFSVSHFTANCPQKKKVKEWEWERRSCAAAPVQAAFQGCTSTPPLPPSPPLVRFQGSAEDLPVMGMHPMRRYSGDNLVVPDFLGIHGESLPKTKEHVLWGCKLRHSDQHQTCTQQPSLSLFHSPRWPFEQSNLKM